MNWILDGAVAAVILGCAAAAWRKGLIRAVIGFLPMALALLGTKAVSPFIGRFLRETILFDKMSDAIQTSMGLDTVLQEGDVLILSGREGGQISGIHLYERKIMKDDEWAGKKLSEISLSGSLVILILRKEQVVIPNGETVLRENDLLYMSDR